MNNAWNFLAQYSFRKSKTHFSKWPCQGSEGARVFSPQTLPLTGWTQLRAVGYQLLSTCRCLQGQAKWWRVRKGLMKRILSWQLEDGCLHWSGQAGDACARAGSVCHRDAVCCGGARCLMFDWLIGCNSSCFSLFFAAPFTFSGPHFLSLVFSCLFRSLMLYFFFFLFL